MNPYWLTDKPAIRDGEWTAGKKYRARSWKYTSPVFGSIDKDAASSVWFNQDGAPVLRRTLRGEVVIGNLSSNDIIEDDHGWLCEPVPTPANSVAVTNEQFALLAEAQGRIGELEREVERLRAELVARDAPQEMDARLCLRTIDRLFLAAQDHLRSERTEDLAIAQKFEWEMVQVLCEALDHLWQWELSYTGTWSCVRCGKSREGDTAE